MSGVIVRRLRAGLDIGGTKILGVVIDDSATEADGAGPRIVARVRVPSGSGPDAVLDAADAVLRALADECGIRADGFASVGIGIPGTVDPPTGIVRQALNLGIEHLDLAADLRARIGREVHVENDVNAAAVGAAAVGAAQSGPASLAYLNLGTGLAAGLVLGGALWRGAGGAAGEIGHVPIDPLGPECPCGQRGCIEVMASGSGIQRQWGAAQAPNAAELLELVAAGDALATRIVDRLVFAVASAVRLLVLTFDVDVVAIGGGLAGGFGDALLLPVQSRLRDWEGTSPFLASLAPADRVVAVPRDRPIAAIGAALAAPILVPSILVPPATASAV
jgi:predicted NBD/HSP70 family sugar kinase